MDADREDEATTARNKIRNGKRKMGHENVAGASVRQSLAPMRSQDFARNNFNGLQNCR
jgi:hypothetical protein